MTFESTDSPPEPPRVSIAVVDSGVHVPHPHLPGVAGGVRLDLEDAASLAKAIEHALQEMRETEA